MFPIINFKPRSDKVEGVLHLKYPELFSSHFIWAVVGAPGSGKTTFIQNLLSQDDLFKGKFEYIFVISPSVINIASIDPECVTNTLKIDWIYERLNYLQT